MALNLGSTVNARPPRAPAAATPAAPSSAPGSGAVARAPAPAPAPGPLELRDGFDAGGRGLPVADVAGRVEQLQTKKTVVQGTSVGVQAPIVLGGTLPTIDQQTPDGDGLYLNGNANCGPTSMAMIARGDPDAEIHGVPVSSMTEAQLVVALGVIGGTGPGGTSPNGEIAMAEALGYDTASAHGGIHPVFIDATLAAGGEVIVNGGVPVGGETIGHYMVVTGKDADGNYVVNDPWTGKTLTLTPEALDAFLEANPVNGGWSIAVW